MNPQDETNEIHFPEGIVGVPQARRFQLLVQPDSPVRLLQCLDIEDFRLPVVDPFLVDADYQPVLGKRVRDFLQVEEGDAILLLAITVLKHDAAPLANLRAPLIVNATRARGMQWILEDPRWSLETPVPELNRPAAVVPTPPARDRRSHARTEP